MNREVVGRSLPVLGLVGALGLFLPGLDKSWSADPGDQEMQIRLRAGETAYVAVAGLLGILDSYAQRSWLPVVLALSFAAVVVGMHESALKHRPQSS